MKKIKNYFFSIFLFSALIGICQMQTVVNTAGNSSTSGSKQLSISVGGSVNASYTKNTKQLNQGFIQNTEVKQVVSLESQKDFLVEVSPNPVIDQLKILVKEEQYATYQIVNNKGQIMLEGEITSSKTMIDLQNLNQGMYILHLVGNDLQTQTNFLKQ